LQQGKESVQQRAFWFLDERPAATLLAGTFELSCRQNMGNLVLTGLPQIPGAVCLTKLALAVKCYVHLNRCA
jgi:hypothetical protein